MMRVDARRTTYMRQLVFFNDPATTEIYALSLHDALPICARHSRGGVGRTRASARIARFGASAHWSTPGAGRRLLLGDRKSTRLNSSHANISYAVSCLKKKHFPLSDMIDFL